MRFVIPKNDFAELVAKLQNVVTQRNAIPILSNFLIEAQNGLLTLTGTDLVVGLRCQAMAKVLEPGAIALPAKVCFQLVKELTADTIELSVSGSTEVAEIRADSSRFRLNGMNRNEYPVLPDLSGATQFRVKQSCLRDLFFRSSFAVSREDNRYALTGVLLEVAHSQATFVGTDGKRLAKSMSKVDLDPSVENDYIVPLKAVEEIMKNLNDDDEKEACISLLNDKIAVEANNATIVTKLLTGDYPDYNRVIPEESEVTITLHREELTCLLRQISLFTLEVGHSVRFSFTEGQLELSANTRQIGEGQVSMPVDYTGSRLDVAFNPNFFLDILKHCKGDTVTLQLSDPYNPGKIQDSDGSTALFVIMPMRLNEE